MLVLLCTTALNGSHMHQWAHSSAQNTACVFFGLQACVFKPDNYRALHGIETDPQRSLFTETPHIVKQRVHYWALQRKPEHLATVSHHWLRLGAVRAVPTYLASTQHNHVSVGSYMNPTLSCAGARLNGTTQRYHSLQLFFFVCLAFLPASLYDPSTSLATHLCNVALHCRHFFSEAEFCSGLMGGAR